MNKEYLIVTALGLLAQGFFSARILVQWYKSEKAGKLTSPTLYWVFSIMGSYLMFIYGWCRDDFSIIFGQFISYYVYLWNLNAKGVWNKIEKGIRVILAATPFVALFFVLNNAGEFFKSFLANDKIPLWLVIFGSLGQLIFTLRFVYQIIYSYRRHESILPLMFWVISLVGSGCIIAYAIIRKDIVLILGQAFGFCAYARNIAIGLSSRKKGPSSE
jgi:Predicted membrane protein